MKRLFVRHVRLLAPLLLLFTPLTATAVEKASVTSKAPITMTVKKQQNLVVQGATVENAKSVSILSARNQAVKAFTTRLSCKAPVRKGAKGSCAVNLTITRAVPLGKYSLNLLDAKRQVLAAGQFEVKTDPAAARAAAVKKQQAEAKRKAALAAKQKAAADQKRALLAKQKADAVRAAAIKKQQAAAKQKAAASKRALLAKQKADAAKVSKKQYTEEKRKSVANNKSGDNKKDDSDKNPPTAKSKDMRKEEVTVNFMEDQKSDLKKIKKPEEKQKEYMPVVSVGSFEAIALPERNISFDQNVEFGVSGINQDVGMPGLNDRSDVNNLKEIDEQQSDLSGITNMLTGRAGFGDEIGTADGGPAITRGGNTTINTEPGMTAPTLDERGTWYGAPENNSGGGKGDKVDKGDKGGKAGKDNKDDKTDKIAKEGVKAEFTADKSLVKLAKDAVGGKTTPNPNDVGRGEDLPEWVEFNLAPEVDAEETVIQYEPGYALSKTMTEAQKKEFEANNNLGDLVNFGSNSDGTLGKTSGSDSDVAVPQPSAFEPRCPADQPDCNRF